MRTVAIINQKGGCGKTTTSINLAACLARLGQKTLLVDMDPQGHCGIGLAVPEEQIERTILDALIEPGDGPTARVNEIVWQIASDFDLAPSSIKLAAFEQLFAGRTGRDERLTRALEAVKPTYGWCIVDCPPSVGLITFNALKACDEVIVPVETGYFSLHGLAKMMETLEVLREKCGRDILIRVLPTLYDTRTKLAREVLSELRGKFKEYLMESTVNFNTKLKEAASFGQPITEYDPGSRGYKDFVNLARELMGHRPLEVETTPQEKLSRPAELVQRAKQLAQLSSYQFGKGSILAQANAAAIAQAGAAVSPALSPSGTVDDLAMERRSRLSLAEPDQPTPLYGGRVVLNDLHTPMQIAPAAKPRPASPTHASPTHATPTPNLPMPASPVVTPGPGATPMQRLSNEPTIAGAPAASTPPAKSTAQKIDEFYGVRQVGSEVEFVTRFENVKSVLIAGDFNNWSAMSTPMRPNAAGEFTTMLPLKAGRYRYRLVVDGVWMTDPHNERVETNQFGELNNIIEVGEV